MEKQNNNNFRESFLGSVIPINEINHRLRENEIQFQHSENFIAYKNTEIRKLQSNTKIFDLASSAMEKRSKLVDQTLSELDFSLDVSQKCSEEKISLQIMLQEKIDSCLENIKLLETDLKIRHNDSLEEYNKVLRMYECYHPLFNQRKKLEIESLKLEVELKLTNKNISNIISQKLTRKEIIKMITQVNIIKFVASIHELQRSKQLQAELEEAQMQEVELAKKLELLDLKRKAMVTSQFKAPSEMPNLEFHQPRMVEDIALTHKSNILPRVSFSIGDARLVNCENWMSGINNRCYQRQQQWHQNQSILTEKLIPQKRPAIDNSAEFRPPPSKQKKCQPIINIKQNTVISKATENKQRVKLQQPAVVEKIKPIEKLVQIENEVANTQISGYFQKRPLETADSTPGKRNIATSSPVYSNSFNDSRLQQNQQDELSYAEEDFQSESGLMDCSLNLSFDNGSDENTLLQVGNSTSENQFAFNFKSSFSNGNNEGGLAKFF